MMHSKKRIKLCSRNFEKWCAIKCRAQLPRGMYIFLNVILYIFYISSVSCHIFSINQHRHSLQYNTSHSHSTSEHYHEANHSNIKLRYLCYQGYFRQTVPWRWIPAGELYRRQQYHVSSAEDRICLLRQRWIIRYSLPSGYNLVGGKGTLLSFGCLTLMLITKAPILNALGWSALPSRQVHVVRIVLPCRSQIGVIIIYA